MNVKFFFIFIIILPFLIVFSSIFANSISVEPIEISITMDDSFIEGNTTKKITITNDFDYDYNVTWYVEHPNPIALMRPNKTYMPDLSWITVKPKWQIVPPKTSRNFYIYLNIPNNEDNLNKNWETWITFKGGEQEPGEGIFNFEYAIRTYIDTPINIKTEENKQNIQPTPIFILTIAILTIILVGILLHKKKRK